jgi:alpha-L-fucosidase
MPHLPYQGDWEVPATLNETWGYSKFDHNWKNPDNIIRLLVKINSRGGNYLLNIGPDALGTIPVESVQILNAVGTYVKENEEAIFGTKRVDGYVYELQGAELTRKDYKLFVHVFDPRTRLELLNIANRIKNAYLVRDGRKLPVITRPTCEGDSSIEIELPNDLRQAKNYCVCLNIEEKDPIFEPLHD